VAVGLADWLLCNTLCMHTGTTQAQHRHVQRGEDEVGRALADEGVVQLLARKEAVAECLVDRQDLQPEGVLGAGELHRAGHPPPIDQPGRAEGPEENGWPVHCPRLQPRQQVLAPACVCVWGGG
jgi:hypothetical protein